MKILITGGAGFVGSNLCKFLSRAQPDWSITVIDDFSTGNVSNLRDASVTLVQASILDQRALSEACIGVDAIVHLAALPSVPRSMNNPRASHAAITDGTFNILEEARLNKAHVIYASSSSVYGANPLLPKKETLMPLPVSPYAAAKLAGENYTLSWGRAFGLDTLAFRFFNIYGPGQSPDSAYAAVVPAFLSRALEGKRPIVHGDGSQTRDFTYVDTVCEVLADSIARRIASPSPVNLAFGTRTSLNELLAVMESTLGRTIPVDHDPVRIGDVPHSTADSSRVKSLFPDVMPHPLERGIVETAAWLQAREGIYE